MSERRDLAFEILAVLGVAAAAAVLFWVVSSWTSLLTWLVAGGVVAVAGAIAWRSRHPYLILTVGVAAAVLVAVSQSYVMLRMFADFCIFEPCAPPQPRVETLLAALPASVLPLALGAVLVAVIARSKRDRSTHRPTA